ncbi:hypothetical protein BKA62DRAFT_684880 [Auriculariales sp. MPI-PUGE-AT-0066]|nr:hypothetical protein BKA62DRAFT_684880 [Auriculariales sp. MPI-PUGE-AT-0066]
MSGRKGIRIGRLRAIFKVTMALKQPLFGHHLPSHLAAVEWYTTIPSQPNRVNGMFYVELARSANGAIQTGIVEVLNIRRACQLIPKFGRDKVDKRLHSGNIMDAYGSFYVNNRADKYAYRSIYCIQMFWWVSSKQCGQCVPVRPPSTLLRACGVCSWNQWSIPMSPRSVAPLP